MKRAWEMFLILVSAPIWAPLTMIVMALVWLRMGRPVVFVQERPGLHGRPFRLIKFRSMRQGVGADEERLTTFGRWLRRTSLDELPELWNVMCGDMALVGPRPLLMAYLPLYTTEQARRHDVRPGLTGWAQVNGRNAQTWDDRLALDVWYVEHHTWCLDMRILVRTLGMVVMGYGICSADHATMPPFAGKTDGGQNNL